ncbi:alpha/beta fold hydrolase [Nocardiopsis sp. RSe5-2]|uniref:Alpha/beta fold hydrolase n=1 Tax=Nocardiopsis endophytica TaxID=3018445 RepID=A0ABT4U1K4_9ACTN|nr:alpha/beta fold hydrolase [Nocardiopsis endophytica]MDA2810836.1 alpha/beta fold hydrolase [Nocardiopsis endophytica]
MTDAPLRTAFLNLPERRMLTTSDGVPIDTVLLRGAPGRTSAVVVANGFTGTWRSPDTRMIAQRLLAAGDVLLFDFRGHYGSGGLSTVGNEEVHDLEAAVAHLRGLGYTDIATIGFSMGAAVVVRHAGLHGGVGAAVSVSGPSRWYYRGSRRMRLLHFGVERAAGRLFLRTARRVRVTDRHWDPVPPDPTEMAAHVAPAPLLVVHGDADAYFPLEHARRLHEASGGRGELWIERGMGHAERAMTPDRAQRVADWIAANRVPAEAL